MKIAKPPQVLLPIVGLTDCCKFLFAISRKAC